MDPIKLFLFFYIVNFIYQTIKLNVQYEKAVIPEVKLEKEVQESKNKNTNIAKQQTFTEMKVEAQKKKMMIYYDRPVAMA